MTKNTLAGIIESTLLRDSLSRNDIELVCKEALMHRFCAGCIPRSYVNHAFSLLKNTPVRVVSVISFPQGTDSTQSKCRQAERLIKAGADEIDMVMNLEKFAREDYNEVLQDMTNTVNTAKNLQYMKRIVSKPVIKVIIETALLRDLEKKRSLAEGALIKIAADLVSKSGADFIKTSTGMHGSGGVHKGDVAFIKTIVPKSVGIKAAGGIRTRKFTEYLVDQGADRIGTSHAAGIMEEFNTV